MNSMVMNPAYQVFHFDSDAFPIEKKEDTTRRGIPVAHYQSCQTWKDMSFLIDYYFQSDDYKQALVFDPTYKKGIN